MCGTSCPTFPQRQPYGSLPRAPVRGRLWPGPPRAVGGGTGLPACWSGIAYGLLGPGGVFPQVVAGLGFCPRKKAGEKGGWVALLLAEDSAHSPRPRWSVRHRSGKYVMQMTFINMQKGPRPVVAAGPRWSGQELSAARFTHDAIVATVPHSHPGERVSHSMMRWS